MANTQNAKKRTRQIERRTAVNVIRTGRIRTFIKKVEAAIEAGDKAVAQDAFKIAMPAMHTGVSQGILHRNTVARKLSRMSARIKSLA
jgi:small subunit ribosomal protein S20